MQTAIATKLLTLTDDNFHTEVELSPNPVVVEFYATWCLPHRNPSPILSDLLAKFDRQMAIGRVDVASAKRIADKYGIRAVPTVAIFKNGKIVYRVIGSPSPAEIIRHLYL